MGEKVKLVLVGLALIASLGACAKEYQEYGIQQGGPHFASFKHMGYSLGGEKPKLTKQELQVAKTEGWWGTPVRYTGDELE